MQTPAANLQGVKQIKVYGYPAKPFIKPIKTFEHEKH